MKGTVKWYDPTKGFGIIQTEEGNELFVHYTSIEDEEFGILEEGEEVSFGVAEGRRGPRAVEVKRDDA